jgi:hypothetical protein
MPTAPPPYNPSQSRPLGGVDVFHLVRDAEMRARGLPGNHCVFVIELAGRVDVARLRRRVARAVDLVPELGAVLGGLWLPEWQPKGRVPEVRELPADTPLESLMDARVDGARPWAIDVVHERAGDRVALRWFHPIADGRSAERLARWLGSGSGEELESPAPPQDRFQTGERPLKGMSREQKIAAMKAYNLHVFDRAKVPVLSPASLAPKGQKLGPTRVIRVELSMEGTARFDQRVRRVAKLAETSLMLVASLRALDGFFTSRGYAPSRYLVPVPLSLDPKAGSRRMLGNQLTMMMFAIDRADLEDEARAVAAIADQQRAIIKEKLDVGMLAALDLARYLPGFVYRAIEARPTHGQISSLVISNPGAVAMEQFLGVEVRDAYPLPTVVLPPGVQVIFTRFRGRLAALLVYLEGVLTTAEAERFADTLRAELTSD